MKQFKIDVSHATPQQLATIALELKIMSKGWTRHGPRIMINGQKLQAPSLRIPGSGRKRGPLVIHKTTHTRYSSPKWQPNEKERGKMNREKFKQWLNKCPVKYDEIPVTSDYDILTINFHGKDIYWYRIIKDHQYEINADGTETEKNSIL